MITLTLMRSNNLVLNSQNTQMSWHALCLVIYKVFPNKLLETFWSNSYASSK